MTLLVDLAPDPRPVLSGADRIEQVLDQLGSDDSVPGADCAALIGRLERIGRRVEALKLRLVARQETADAATSAGFADTGAWLARQTRATRDQATRQVRLATDLRAARVTDAALAAGDLSPAHAVVVTHPLTMLPGTVTPAQRARVETDLVAKAARFDPQQLRRIARRALETVEPDPTVVDAHENALLHDEERAAHERLRFTFHDNHDGTVTAHFTTTAVAFAMLRKVIDAMTAPRRAGSRVDLHRLELPTDWARRRGEAFTQVLEHLPTDHLHPKTAATVVVHLRHEVLLGALAAAGTDVDQPISAGEARRLACGARIIPSVLGGRSVPLDLGRTQRLFTEAQRVALATRHTTCGADGCTRPFAWCELHHLRPWSHGGRTDLDQAVPLCWYHHRRIHDPAYHHQVRPDGITFHRRT